MFGIGKKDIGIESQYTIFHEDYSLKDVNEKLVGRKGLSLFTLKDMDVPIPDFFVVTPSVYKDFILSPIVKLLDKEKDAYDVRDLEKIIFSTDFEKNVKEEILKCYSRISGFSNSWVAVRSSVVFPEDPSVTFSGLLHTELSVRGIDQVFEAIKYVYLSLFKERVILYAREKSVDLSKVELAIVVQRMVQPEVSGIAYTVDPITNDNKKMSIEAVFGLGDVITDGSITPDQYILEKKDLNVIEKRISPQEWMRIRKPGDSKVGSLNSFQKIQISNAWSHQQKIEDKYLKDIAKVALVIESKSKEAEIIEWTWESGNVWVLQNKSMFKKSESPSLIQENNNLNEQSVYDIAIGMINNQKDDEETPEELNKTETQESQNIAVLSAEDLIAASIQSNEINETQTPKETVKVDEKKLARMKARFDRREARKLRKEKEEKVRLEKFQEKAKDDLGITEFETSGNMEFLLSGIGASNGVADGQLIIVKKQNLNEIIVNKNTVLLMKEFTPEYTGKVLECGGIIMDGGGLTSDVSILCRELGIPAVVGTGLGSTLLNDGDLIRIDGNVGSIYRYSQAQEGKKEVVEVEISSTKKEDNRATIADSKTKDKEDEKIAEVIMPDKDEKPVQKEEKVEVKSEKEYIEDEIKLDTDEEFIKPNEVEIPEKTYFTATKLFISPDKKTRASDYEKFINNSNGFCYIDLESLMVELGKHPMSYVKNNSFKAFSKQIEIIIDDYADLVKGNEVIVSIGSLSVGQLKELTNGKSLEKKELGDDLYGAQRLINEKEMFEKEISIIKILRNVYKNRNLSIAIHSPMNSTVVKDLKKEISSFGLRRTGTLKMYGILENPTEIILAEDIAKAGLDGLIINTPGFALQMQGYSRTAQNVKYDIGVNSIWKIISELVEKVKDMKIEVIVSVEDNSKLLKNCVKAGVYGVSVFPEFTEKYKKLISEEETKMILNSES